MMHVLDVTELNALEEFCLECVNSTTLEIKERGPRLARSLEHADPNLGVMGSIPVLSTEILRNKNL